MRGLLHARTIANGMPKRTDRSSGLGEAPMPAASRCRISSHKSGDAPASSLEETQVRLTPSIASAVVVAAALAFPAVASAKEFRSADVHPEDYPTVMAVKYMSDIIEQEDRRQAHDQGLHRQPARRREGHDRADEDRRARPRAHQRRADEQHLPRDDGADDAVPVQLEGAHAQGARRPDRRRDPEGLREAGLRRRSRSTTRARARSTRSRSRSSRWPTSRA